MYAVPPNCESVSRSSCSSLLSCCTHYRRGVFMRFIDRLSMGQGGGLGGGKEVCDGILLIRRLARLAATSSEGGTQD